MAATSHLSAAPADDSIEPGTADAVALADDATDATFMSPPTKPGPATPPNPMVTELFSGATLGDVHAALLRRCPQFSKLEGWLDIGEGCGLYDLASRVDPLKGEVIVEVGSYRGKSTVALALGSHVETRVYAFDPHEMCVGSNGGVYGPIDRLHFNRVLEITGTYAKVRPMSCGTELVAAAWNRPVGLCFIDGDHTYEGARKDAVGWAPHVVVSGVMAFDDINLEGPGRVLREMAALDNWNMLGVLGKIGFIMKVAK
jgi:hypothetical protein